MAYKIYQKLQSGMANQGLLDAADVDVMEDGQRVTLAEKLSDLTEDVADMAEDVAGAVAVATGIKTAQGQEVGDVAETDIAVGVLIWHGGKLYRVLSLIAAGDRWQDMDVTETSVSEEINAMRGVSTEGVYLTISPASAIPVAGVKARIYNASTDTYLPEVTFTSASNRQLLGRIAYGDVYTIIMPSIDGYTQPADQTFKAGQMLRQRTVEYVESATTLTEALTIKATKSNSAAIGACNAVVKQYDSNGNVTSTTNLSIEGGTSETIHIALGTKYSVEYPDISGFITPYSQMFIARTNTRTCYGTYVYLLGSEYKWVIYDGQNISYMDFDDPDITLAIANDTLYGVAYMTSALLTNNAAFIYSFSLSSDRTSYWSKEADVNAPSAVSEWKGRENSASALDAILQYELDNNTTITSIFKVANAVTTGFEENGVPIKMFVPAYRQVFEMEDKRGTVNNVLTRYNAGKSISYMASVGCSEQTSANRHRGTVNNNRSGRNKTSTTQFNLVLPILTTNVITT